MIAEHAIDTSRPHHDWDNSREPVITIESGDVVHFDLLMTGDGQVREDSTVDQ
jgi:acetamidase/formamidase